MAYIQKTTPPLNKVYSFSLKNFNGGLNNRSEQLNDNQASDLMNMMFSDNTLMENRYGQKFYDDFVADGSLIFIDEFKPYKDVPVLLRATEDFLYIGDDVLTDIAGKPCGVNHQGRYFFADGEHIWVYGKFAQTTSTYEKVIGTPINDYVLMEVVSPSDGHPQLSSEHVRGVLNIDYTNYKVFYEPCKLEFEDNYSGANKVPLGVKYIVSHNGRIYVTGHDEDDDNVFISDVQNPFYFPVSLPIQLPPNSDKVVGMNVYDNSVVVGRSNDIYVITGNTNRPDMGVEVFQLRKLNTHTGFASNDAVRVAHNYLFFLGADGNAYSLASVRNDVKVLSTSIMTKDIDIEKHPINISKSEIFEACSCFIDDLWYLSIKDKVLVYSYEHRSWTVYENLDARSFYNHNHQLIWGRSDGKTATFDKDNFLDFNMPYQSYWYSRRFDMNDANSFKQFRDFFLVAHVYELHPSDINIIFEIDYDDVKDRVVISNKMSVWGRSVWGDRFITRNIAESLPFTIGRRGRSIRFKLSCSYKLDGTVDTQGDLIHYPSKRDGLLVKVLDEDAYYLYNKREWHLTPVEVLNQRMKIYQVNGEYELRGKR